MEMTAPRYEVGPERTDTLFLLNLVAEGESVIGLSEYTGTVPLRAAKPALDEDDDVVDDDDEDEDEDDLDEDDDLEDDDEDLDDEDEDDEELEDDEDENDEDEDDEELEDDDDPKPLKVKSRG